MNNAIFSQARRALAHPIMIAAVLILLFNDHHLRYAQPSWLTGKLGDFTWLIFAPLIAAFFLALILPKKWQRYTGAVAFTFIGLWFATAKTIPFAHHLTVTALQWIIGWQPTLRMDTSDLLTLPGLWVGWWVWRRSAQHHDWNRSLATVALGLGIVSTLADSPRLPNRGLHCFREVDNTLFVIDDEWKVFSSEDDGYTWKPSTQRFDNYENNPCGSGLEYRQGTTSPPIIANPQNPDNLFRIWTGHIEVSYNGGQTWEFDHELPELNLEVRQRYITRRANLPSGGFYNRIAGTPIDAIFHHENLLITAGLNGILLREPDGEWHWIDVGLYYLDPIGSWDQALTVIHVELFAAAVISLLVVPATFGLANRMGTWSIVGFVFGTGSWLLAFTIMQPYEDGIIGTVIVGFCLFTVICTFATNIILWRRVPNWKLRLHLFGFVVLTVALFIFPYLLWARGTIPVYRTASIFAIFLAGMSIIAGHRYFHLQLQRLSPNKQKRTAP